MAATVQGAELLNDGNTQSFIHGTTINADHPVMDIADTLPWICPNGTTSATEAIKPALHNDVVDNYWHSAGARQKVSTPKNLSDVVWHRGKSSWKANKKSLTLTPLPELSVHGMRYDPLTLNDQEVNIGVETRDSNHSI